MGVIAILTVLSAWAYVFGCTRLLPFMSDLLGRLYPRFGFNRFLKRNRVLWP
jgi:hypothetical protein